MAKADEDSSWISHNDAVELLQVYQSKTEAILRTRGLMTGKVPWRCGELVGRRRPSDPDRGDPDFWRRESKYVQLESRPHENWARRRLLQAVPHRRHIVLCDYQAFGIKLAREAVIALLPSAAQVSSMTPATTAVVRSRIKGQAWIIDEALRMKKAGEIPNGVHKTEFAQKLAARMAEAAAAGTPVRAIQWDSIRNDLETWGIWPVESIRP